jgi:hypothetical protein
MVLPTGWGEVKAAMVADAAAGFTPTEIAKRSGWGVGTALSVLRQAGVEQPNTMWARRELDAIRPATSKEEAIALYREAMGPDARRTDMAIRRRWMRGGLEPRDPAKPTVGAWGQTRRHRGGIA